MKKKGVTLLSGVLCMGCLFGIYGFLKTENKKKEEAQEAEANQPILDLDWENPETLSFQIGENKTTFTCEDGSWKKSDDETFPVKEEAVREVLADLAALSAVRTLGEAEDISDYGFENPMNCFVYTDCAGNTAALTIGTNNAATGDDYFLTEINGTKEVYTISSSLRSSISGDLYDYALAEELPSILEEEIQAVRVTAKDGGYRIYKEETGWYAAAEDGTSFEAEEETVENEIGTLVYSLSYADFLDHNCEDPENYGIGSGSTIFTIEYVKSEEQETASEEMQSEERLQKEAEEQETEKEQNVSEKETEELSFYIGDTDSQGNYYVQKKDSNEIHTISYDVLSPFLEETAETWKAVEAETETESAAETETESAAEVESDTE